MGTEVAVGEINPVFLTSYSFNSANFLQIHMKVELYYSITGKNSTERGQSSLQGEVQFTVEDLIKNRSAVGTISYLLRSAKPSADRNLMRRNSELNIRLEEIEQTNDIVQL